MTAAAAVGLTMSAAQAQEAGSAGSLSEASSAAIGGLTAGGSNSDAGNSKYLYATQPEGQALSEKMLRLRLPYGMQTGNFGYDGDGKKVANGFNAKAAGGAFVLEYGLTNRISLQFLMRYISSMEVTVDASTFKKSDLYKATRDEVYTSKFGAGVTPENLSAVLTQKIAGALVEQGACGTVVIASCVNNINGGMTAPAALPASATGLPSDIPAGAPLKGALAQQASAINSAVESQILAGAKSAEKKGATGLGDTEIGVLYEVLAQKPVFFSVAGGLRLPTGKFTDISANEIPTSRGVYEFGLRTNLDLLPVDWFMISWQNQAEAMVMKGKEKVGGKTEDAKRKGVRQVGFVYLKPSLVPLSRSLNVLAPRVGFTYDHDSALYVGDQAVPPRSYQHNWLVGMGFDLTRLNVPLQLDLDYTQPFDGKNVAVATGGLLATLKAYYVF